MLFSFGYRSGLSCYLQYNTADSQIPYVPPAVFMPEAELLFITGLLQPVRSPPFPHSPQNQNRRRLTAECSKETSAFEPDGKDAYQKRRIRQEINPVDMVCFTACDLIIFPVRIRTVPCTPQGTGCRQTA